MNIKSILIGSLLFASLPLFAQQEEVKKDRKAWEFGLGAGLLQHSRLNFGNVTNNKSSFVTKLKIHQVLLSGNLYIANEIKSWLYWDIQGSYGYDRVKEERKTRYDSFYYLGPGLQFRLLSNKSKSSFVEPYFRIGINYFHKDFSSVYKGALQSKDGGEYPFEVSDLVNENREDKNSFFPFSLGVGLNSWFNNNWGVGIQADYIAAFYDKTPHYPSISLRGVYRLGGKKKKQSEKKVEVVYKDRIEYKTIEKIIEKPVFQKEIEQIYVILENLYFGFDSSDFVKDSSDKLDKLAELLKSKSLEDYNFLITAHTDSRGSAKYNVALSKRRAISAMKALEERGVPSDRVKARGVGKLISIASPSQDNKVRLGDRKITIELIRNMDYWSVIPKEPN